MALIELRGQALCLCVAPCRIDLMALSAILISVSLACISRNVEVVPWRVQLYLDLYNRSKFRVFLVRRQILLLWKHDQCTRSLALCPMSEVQASASAASQILVSCGVSPNKGLPKTIYAAVHWPIILIIAMMAS